MLRESVLSSMKVCAPPGPIASTRSAPPVDAALSGELSLQFRSAQLSSSALRRIVSWPSNCAMPPPPVSGFSVNAVLPSITESSISTVEASILIAPPKTAGPTAVLSTRVELRIVRSALSTSTAAPPVMLPNDSPPLSVNPSSLTLPPRISNSRYSAPELNRWITAPFPTISRSPVRIGVPLEVPGARLDRLVLTADHEYVLEGPWPGTSSGTPILTGDLEIVGNGAVIHRFNSGAEYRLFEIRGGSVKLDGLTLSGGLSFGSMTGGAAVLVDSADLTIRNSTLVDNAAVGPAVFGGAIRMDASTVLIEDSVIEGNTAFTENPETGGGGIAQFDGQLTIRRSALLDNWADLNCNESSPDSAASTGGALRVEAIGPGGAQTFIEDSTLSRNIGRLGGAIHVVADADTGVSGIQDVFVQVMRSTVVYNRAPTCGGLIGAGDGFYVQESSGGQGLIAYGNSIVLGNSRSINGELVGDDCSSDTPNSDFYSLDGNVIDPEDSCPTFGFDASASFAFSVVSPRQNNAYSPDPAGPAVDLPEAAINCDLSAPDQLGNPRAAGPGQGGVLCDAGAVELQPVGFEYTLQVTTDGSGTITSIPAGIDCPGTCAADFPAGSDV